MTFTVTPANGLSCAKAGAPTSAAKAEKPARKTPILIRLPPVLTGTCSCENQAAGISPSVAVAKARHQRLPSTISASHSESSALPQREVRCPGSFPADAYRSKACPWARPEGAQSLQVGVAEQH